MYKFCGNRGESNNFCRNGGTCNKYYGSVGGMDAPVTVERKSITKGRLALENLYIGRHGTMQRGAIVIA